MCGIAGIAYPDGRTVSQQTLVEMTASMAHRGPDHQGVKVISPMADGDRSRAVNVGLGHRRLSIIDLSAAGAQPMANEDGRIWVTFNGEIYNYRELKKSLLARGHRFQSDTDTEVLLHGYEEYGESLFKRLNGMFAFGIWDSRQQLLYLVRDRYGQKPLYFWKHASGVVFASELKAFLQHPDFSREIDLQNLSRYLLYEYLPSPHTIYKGVNKLMAGHYLRWSTKDVSIKPYWQIQFLNGLKPSRIDEPEAEGLLIKHLRSSVQRRLMSDVPLGVFLSGGIDSSGILALMSELVPADRIKTFSIGFEESSFDESSYARLVADHFGTDHYENVLTAKKVIDIIPEVWDRIDEPFADASIIPTYLLSKFTRQHVTVALGGDGGDELFAGYDPFLAHRLAGYYDKIPKFFHHHLIRPLINRLPASDRNMSLEFRLKHFIKGFCLSPARRNQTWLSAFSADQQKEIFKPEIGHILNGFDPGRDTEEACAGMRFRDLTDQIIFLYSRFYLAEDILTKVDRASMATSLEVRSPFLDVTLAEFVNQLPSNMKLKGLTRKYLLKKSLRSRLPANVITRSKKGFGVPLAKWFRKELKPILLEAFDPRILKEQGLFRPEAVHRLLQEHFDGRKDNRKQIWTLLNFQMWQARYG